MSFTTRDLLEYASLDALGLLDEGEREEFERAFRTASPEVQAMVRREQTRTSDISDWLPAVDAPAGLKARVLAAWRDAVAAVAPEPVGSITPAVPQFSFGLRTGYIWRAACIGFATATLVLSGFFIWGLQLNNELRDQIVQNKTTADVSAFGSGFRNVFFSATKRELALVPAAEGLNANVQGRLIVDQESGAGVLAFQRLPTDSGQYRVVIRTPKGDEVLANFKSTGGLTSVPVDLKRLVTRDSIASLDQLAIVGPSEAGGQDVVVFRVKLA